ncbi:MAG TPA: FmdB family zinc ribbon protein [Thermoanaerobaculia bacterium]|nr:FmdB family zinc ribbon protein [Thermoanaerobaculia bacterium]
MPLYEYQCKACSAKIEVIQKFADAPISVCPSCGGDMKKLISSPAIQFKGSGFYITDYSKGNSGSNTQPGSAASSEGKAEGSGGGDKSDKSGGTGESKGESKKESSTASVTTESKPVAS